MEKAKYGINFDVGCMIDGEWIDSLANRKVQYPILSREELIQAFVDYYSGFEAEDSESLISPLADPFSRVKR